MRLFVFVAGMILAMLIVGAISASAGVSAWGIVLRVACTGIIAQFLYLGMIVWMARSGSEKTVEKVDSSPTAFPSTNEAETR